MAYFGMPGPVELLVILAILAIIAAPVVALVVVLLLIRKRESTTASPAGCPNCGGWIVAQAKFCHHCGNRLTA